jgi:hypothetical protein
MKTCATGSRKLICLHLWFALSQTCIAAEYINEETPAPESASKLNGAFNYAFTARPPVERFRLKKAKEILEDNSPFWRDTKLSFDFRTYYFDRSILGTGTQEAWAAGGRLAYESGWWNNFGIRTVYYNSSKVNAPENSFDTGLLAPGQEMISVMGEANLRYRFTSTPLEGSLIQLYRQTLNLPYINKHDIRMLPATHEGYTIQRANSSFDYVAGHLTKFKNYDSEEFVSISAAAGARGTDKGLSMAGARIPVSDQITLGAINYYGWDTFNTFFTEATYHAVLRGNLDMKLFGQFTDQRSTGDELVGKFTTNQLATQAAFGWRGAVIKIAASVTDDGAGIRSPWGGKPSYLSLQRLDFDRANEKAIKLGLSYNPDFFSSLGLSSFINIARGVDAIDPLLGVDLPNQNEYDITIDYKPPEGILEGLWFRARAAFLDIDGDDQSWYDVRDYRIIVNYNIPFL